jgi:hypothetical protein
MFIRLGSFNTILEKLVATALPAVLQDLLWISELVAKWVLVNMDFEG